MNYLCGLFSTLFLVSAGVGLLPSQVTDAVTLTNGSVSFTEPPRLVNASTPYTDTGVWDTTYYFTIEIPANAGEPLQKVTFAQKEGTERIRFEKNGNIAFEGTRNHQGPKLTLQPGISDASQRTFTVTFDSPVPPGKVITIGLRPVRNPLFDGIYLFGVTAFPSGEQATGQFIGIGRLQFYTDGDSGN